MGKLLLLLFLVYVAMAVMMPKQVSILARAYLTLSLISAVIGVVTGYWW